MMKQLSLLFTFIFSIAIFAQKNPKEITQFKSDLDQKIPQYLHDFIVPGIGIAIIENGKVILQKGYGFSNVDKGIKVENTTGFNIGSISKTFAAWGVMKLVQEGRIDLDAPAEKYLTRWHLPKSKYDSNKVTIRRLLSHTAGLSLHGYPGWSPKDSLPTIEESLNGKNNGPERVEMIMEPGTKWKYSGGGYTMLQLIIEEVTKQKFEDYMQTEILTPLGMSNSSYTIDDKILKASSLEHNPFGEAMDFELFTAKAAAGMHTTIEDFTKFAFASLYKSNNNNKFQQVLSTRFLKEMMEPAPVSNGIYGLGYQIESIRDANMNLVGHGGANAGWHALFRINPETNDGFIVITNGANGFNLYNQVYCDWINWKTNGAIGDRCNVLPSVANKLMQIINEKGIGNLKSYYEDLKKNHASSYNFSTDQLNQLGYYYLGKNKIDYSIAIFKINVEAFPKSSNVYDSYAEALLRNGEKEKAIENYKKSVELNPANEGGINALKKLGINTDGLIKEIIIDEKTLQTYTGRYELAPGFVLTISREGTQLKAQATGQGEFDIFPKSINVFYLKVAEAEVTFNLNGEGKVVSMTLLQGGRETTGLKLKD